MRIPSTSLAIRAASTSPSNKSTAVTISTWVCLGVFIAVVISKVVIKFGVRRRLGFDDAVILLATVFATALSVTTHILVSNGLGALGNITLKHANALQKGYYASDFLYIASLCFAKLSLLFFLHGIVVQQRGQRRIVLGISIFVLIWTSASLVAVGLQCGLPKPWEMMTLHCYNSGLFWIVYCIIDMTLEVSIIMLSVNLVAYIKIRLSQKLVVVACFAPRILVVAAALARLIYLYPITPHDDPQFNLWIPVICTQIQVCLAVSTACIPYMMQLFGGDGSVWKVKNFRRRTTYNVSRSGSALLTTHRRGKEQLSTDSTAAVSVTNGRAPDISPRIPTPAPLSPLTPPRYKTPSQSSRKSSIRGINERGLRLHIPPPEIRATSASSSPRTASSFALSPQCLSPQPLLSPSGSSPNRGSSPPPRTQTLRPNVSTSFSGTPNPESSPVSNLLSPSQSPNPQGSPGTSARQSSSTRYSLIPHIHPTPPPIIPRSNSRPRRRISVHRMQPNSRASRTTSNYPPRSSSRQPPPPGSTPPIPAPYPRTPPTQLTDTPIPAYYNTPPPTNPPIFPVPTPPQTSPRSRTRNQRILSPQNSSRREHISPVWPASPPTPVTFYRDESSQYSISTAAGASAGSTRQIPPPWDADQMPVVRELRSSPRIIVHRGL
ncbi:hypothetical protein K491DRAFT_714208 [Lophiostoma macrostomum CBS 122681]|uniref:Rhodopsin domain-containing protein n=1 Tax=Lophiostoma macrostomum CBS 122681 TaxID=1314788 RepID=A0A6A6TCK3_9PLEO|nr:hypothetical protein K491DRAFT_714208 [Lophiostoma macrostomum CBS 122681]